MADLPNWKKNKVAYNAAYNRANYSRVIMEIPKEAKARIQARAQAAGLSMTAYIMRCVEQAEE